MSDLSDVVRAKLEERRIQRAEDEPFDSPAEETMMAQARDADAALLAVLALHPTSEPTHPARKPFCRADHQDVPCDHIRAIAHALGVTEEER
jgi:hypothetical protein